MMALVSILAMAALFVAFAWVRNDSGCGGSCGECASDCRLDSEGGVDD